MKVSKAAVNFRAFDGVTEDLGIWLNVKLHNCKFTGGE